MTLAQGVPCPGAGHAILAPARVADQRLRRPGPLAAQALGRPPAPAARRHPLRHGAPHRHLLVPRRRHHRRLPPRLHHRLRRRPAGRPHGPQHPARRPSRCWTPSACSLAIDDTPTARYGPCVEGAGIHHNPSPGPAGEKYVYGHVWVTLAALAKHPDWGTLALPLQAQLYIRAADLGKLPPERRRPFHTKLELAAEQLRWLKPWVESDFEERWVVVDGGYAKRPFLRPAQAGRLDGGRPPAQGRGLVVTALAQAAEPARAASDLRQGAVCPWPSGPGSKRGWQQVECVQYGEKVTKTIKTFLATWHPAGGVIRVVLVQEEDGWVAFFCTKPEATAVEILEAVADRNADGADDQGRQGGMRGRASSRCATCTATRAAST